MIRLVSAMFAASLLVACSGQTRTRSTDEPPAPDPTSPHAEKVVVSPASPSLRAQDRRLGDVRDRKLKDGRIVARCYITGPFSGRSVAAQGQFEVQVQRGGETILTLTGNDGSVSIPPIGEMGSRIDIVVVGQSPGNNRPGGAPTGPTMSFRDRGRNATARIGDPECVGKGLDVGGGNDLCNPRQCPSGGRGIDEVKVDPNGLKTEHDPHAPPDAGLTP